MTMADRGRVIHTNPVTGLTSYWLEDGEGNYVIYEEQDAEPIMELAHHLSVDFTPSLDLRHIGEVPLPFLDQAIREGWVDDPVAWRRFLRDNSRFQVHKW